MSEDEFLAKAGLDSLAGSNRLGALLMQFPVSFKNSPENREYLEQLLKRFAEYPCVVEVRHATWNEPEILAHLAENQVGFVNIDQPILGRAIKPSEYVTSHVGYVRLHGRNYKDWFDSSGSDRYNYLYKSNELEEWTGRIKIISKDAAKTFVITNNHPNGRAAVNALELKSMLAGTKVKTPDSLSKCYPDRLEQISEDSAFSLLF